MATLFLEAMTRVHESRGAPCTLFIRGSTLEKNAKQLGQLAREPLYDLQQHTYSHLIFKRIEADTGKKHEVYGNDEPVEKIKKDVERASKLFRKKLGTSPIGLTTPYAFYRGLLDRPDILEVLHDCGIRFLRSWGRNEKGYTPVPLDVQPFFYDEQGFPDILECPVNGWQDCIWRADNGWKARWDKTFIADLDHVARRDGYIALCQHDWSSIQEDPLAMTDTIISHAKDAGVRIISYKTLYEEMLQQRGK
ncbi:MAG: polysaccharide deacetylase family protein [Candidatus Lokiarchaeota archaeon]|nr:polysaccharide deacetylase family protein [Candidatus Lokiarchaeota archaeon]